MKILLIGRPGAGKTTVIQKVISRIEISAGRFYTHEMKGGLRQGRRIGFSLRTLDGAEGILAHIDHPMKDRVGRYGVDLAFFEAVALPSLEQALRERDSSSSTRSVGWNSCRGDFRIWSYGLWIKIRDTFSASSIRPEIPFQQPSGRGGMWRSLR
jgi:hypothetical protein